MHSEEIHIRSAEARDGEHWLELIDALAAYEKLQPPDQAARARLLKDAFGERRRFDVFVAEFSGRLVGYAITFETYSSFLALPTLYLEDLFVLPEYRGRKAGYGLFEHCVREAQRRGCGRMEWQVLDWNQLAIDFYERLGARQLKQWVSYRLLGDDMQRLTKSASGSV